MMDYTKLKVGDIFYECGHGFNFKLEVLTEPTVTTEERTTRWFWKSKRVSTGEVLDYLVTEGLEQYGPKLYREPSYSGKILGDEVHE